MGVYDVNMTTQLCSLIIIITYYGHFLNKDIDLELLYKKMPLFSFILNEEFVVKKQKKIGLKIKGMRVDN